MKKELLFIGALVMCCSAHAQRNNGVSVSGSVQSDMLLSKEKHDGEHFMTNTYADATLQSKWVDAGARFEFTQIPLPGFNDPENGIDFKGWGVPNIWVKGKFNRVEVTAGNVYDQFGSGFIFRTYEERSLGVDNSILGGRVTYNPVNGVNLKVLAGMQRNYWKLNKSVIMGADAEVAIDEWIPKWKNNGTHLTLGGSWVNRRQNKEDGNTTIEQYETLPNAKVTNTYMLNVPTYVNAFDARIKFQSNGFSALAEYAQKSQDPNTLNSYTYGKGHAEMLSLSYTKKGFSALGQVKRSENMGFRSDRGMSTVSSAGYINHLPAFTLDHTYSLAALYPYATQTDGEWAYQGSVAYKFKGRYAPKFKVNYSRVNGLENARQNVANNEMRGTDGAKSAFFKQGETYYQDLNLQYEQKYNKAFELHLMYMWQKYNMSIIRGHGGMVDSHIAIAEGKYKFNKKISLRAEAQYLYTAHESGDWGFGLLELSIAPHLMISVSDQIGRPEPEVGASEYGDITHYYNASVTGNWKSHRLQIGYGKTRAGYNCTGGVCRYVPAYQGVTLSYNYNF